MGYIVKMDEKMTEAKENPSLGEKLLKTRSVMISGEINKDLSDKFSKEMLVLDSESNDEITVYINSPGGDVDSGFAIFDMIRYVKSPVTIIGVGLVASAAALIYLSVPKERRLAFPHSTYLIHQPLSQMKGVAIDIDIYAKKIAQLREALDTLIAQETGQRKEKVTEDTERDYWLTAPEAKEYGIVGKIIDKRA